MSRRVLILGCGPAGLLAAHAVVLAGGEPIVVSVKRKSYLFGCQYLHEPIPSIAAVIESETVEYILRGDPDDYRSKVYGPESKVKVSPLTLPSRHEAFDIRAAYDELWDLYSDLIDDWEITPDDIEPMTDHYKPNLAFSSIPLPRTCSKPEEHEFKSVSCWAVGDAPELGQAAPLVAPPFTVICDATPETGYYRASSVFDYATVEWPGWKRKPPIEGVVEFRKPVSTTCDCWPQLQRIGRMGEWTKGVLAHQAFQKVRLALEDL